jgi:antitoxin VapB
MSLNIKNVETYRLIRELADTTGESMTEAVTVAVRERLARVRPGIDLDRLEALLDDVHRRVPSGFFDVEHGELLYDDELGLPK